MDSFFELDIHKPRNVSEVLSKLSLPLHKLPNDEKELITIIHSATADKVLKILGLDELELIENVKQTFTRDKIALVVWHATNSIMWSYIKDKGLLPYNENEILNIFRKEISKIHEVGRSNKKWRQFLANTDYCNFYQCLRRKERPGIYFHVDCRIFEIEKEYVVGIIGPEGRISFYRDLIDWSKKKNISVEKLILYLEDPEKHKGIILKCYLTPEILEEKWRQVARLVLEFAVAIKLGSYPSTTFTLHRKLPKENIIPKFWVEGIIPLDMINGKPIKIKFQGIRFP